MTEPQNDLRQRRERAGYTQATLGNAIGTSEQTVRKWEQGTSVPQLGRRRALAEALGITMDEVLVLVRAIERQKAAMTKDALKPLDQGAARKTPRGRKQ